MRSGDWFFSLGNGNPSISFYVCFRKILAKMQDQNEDTEWNDILRAKGIIPEKPKEKEITEDDIVSMLEQTVKAKTSGKCEEIRCINFFAYI